MEARHDYSFYIFISPRCMPLFPYIFATIIYMMSVCLSFLAVTRPTIGQLNKFVIPRVLHKWYDLGLQLLGAGEAERLNSYTGGSSETMFRDAPGLAAKKS